MYIVIRTWENAGALAEALVKRQQEVKEVIGGVPGLVNYYVTRSGETLTTVTVTETHDGAKESTKRAGEWVKANLAGSGIGTPQITEGDVFVHL